MNNIHEANATETPPSTERLLMPVTDTARTLGVGLTTTWKLIANGKLETVKIGRRTLVKAASVHRLVDEGA